MIIIMVTGVACAQVDPCGMAEFRPQRRPWSQQYMAQLKMPAGFVINVFAGQLGNARMLAVDSDSAVYVTCPSQNRVTVMLDKDRDGSAESIHTLFSDLPDVHGITIDGNTMYLAAPQKVWLSRRQGTSWSKPTIIINDLPPGPWHQNRTLAVGPDRKLYISVGSSCNACKEINPEYAAILVCELDGTGRKLYASGLRNTIGFDFHPVTRQMWGMDHGSDWRGNSIPPEELNLLLPGKNYGWPYAYANQQIDPFMEDPPGKTKEAYALDTQPAVLTYTAHSAPIGMCFYDANQFPPYYKNCAFVAFHGSWNRYPPSGYKIAMIKFDEQGRPIRFEDFVTGFLIEDANAYFGRPTGVAVNTDGSLLFADDVNGYIYRVKYNPNLSSNL